MLFASSKIRVDDFVNFWDALRANIMANKVLEALEINAESCANLFYGVLWLNQANWEGVPIDRDSGEISWKVSSQWNIAAFLPPAVRPSFYLYTGEFLLEPQRKLFMSSTGVKETEVADDIKLQDKAQDEARVQEPEDVPTMDMDDVGDGCALDHDDREFDNAMDVDPAPVTETHESNGVNEEIETPAVNMSKVLDDQKKYIQTVFFPQLHSRMIKYLEDMQIQQQNETPGSADQVLDDDLLKDNSDSEGSDEDDIQIEDKAYRRRERLRRFLQEKWAFPTPPGKYRESSTVGIEFMKMLLKVFRLDSMLKNENNVLLDKMCAKMSISTFDDRISFKTPRFPIVLRDVSCVFCSSTSQVDVTAHPSRGPGLWVCDTCNFLYDKETMQARLVATLESCVQAWQAQEVVCKRCMRLRTSNLLNFCDCYGTFRTRFDKEELRVVFSVMRSVAKAHDLMWLHETVDTYESLL